MALTEDILRKKFGYNDPNFIRSILSGGEPELAARLERESQPAPTPAPTPVQPAQDFQKEQRERQDTFFGKLKEVPEQLEAVRNAIGLPQAFESARGFGTAAREIGYQVEDKPDIIRQAIEQGAGGELTAGQIKARTASDVASFLRDSLPALRESARGLEAAQQLVSSLANQYQVESSQIFTPLSIEAGLLGESMAQEYGLFKQQIDANLQRELAQLQETGATDRANIQRAIELAKMEQAANEGVVLNLGDRAALVNPTTGEEIKSFALGLAPKKGSGSTDWTKYLGESAKIISPQNQSLGSIWDNYVNGFKTVGEGVVYE